jgi:hypothetical protein
VGTEGLDGSLKCTTTSAKESTKGKVATLGLVCSNGLVVYAMRLALIHNASSNLNTQREKGSARTCC